MSPFENKLILQRLGLMFDLERRYADRDAVQAGLEAMTRVRELEAELERLETEHAHGL